MQGGGSGGGLVAKLRPTLASSWTLTSQALLSMGFTRQEYWSGLTSQALLSMGFTRQEYWSGLPFPSSGKSFRPKDRTRVSCIAGGFFMSEPPGGNITQGTLLNVTWQLGWEGAWGRMGTCVCMA